MGDAERAAGALRLLLAAEDADADPRALRRRARVRLLVEDRLRTTDLGTAALARLGAEPGGGAFAIAVSVLADEIARDATFASFLDEAVAEARRPEAPAGPTAATPPAPPATAPAGPAPTGPPDAPPSVSAGDTAGVPPSVSAGGPSGARPPVPPAPPLAPYGGDPYGPVPPQGASAAYLLPPAARGPLPPALARHPWWIWLLGFPTVAVLSLLLALLGFGPVGLVLGPLALVCLMSSFGWALWLLRSYHSTSLVAAASFHGGLLLVAALSILGNLV
ncbi:hypothetical protein [Streptomyces omiyaensis]|uniref:hypothetical protein n=1 Tax=Streptomyces omiyaensis TaxID=68247 RepID=UPI0036F4FBDB